MGHGRVVRGPNVVEPNGCFRFEWKVIAGVLQGLENRPVEGVAFVKLELGWIVVKPPRNVVLAPLTLFERQEL